MACALTCTDKHTCTCLFVCSREGAFSVIDIIPTLAVTVHPPPRCVLYLEAAGEEELTLLEEARGFVEEARAARDADLEEAADVLGEGCATQDAHPCHACAPPDT